jgi:hypothetical protein
VGNSSTKFKWVLWPAVILLVALFIMGSGQGNQKQGSQLFVGQTAQNQGPAQNPAVAELQLQTLQTFISSPTTNMKITSPVFGNNGNIPPHYTCDGESLIPTLQFNDIPAKTKSLALIVHDPDAPGAGGFTHWVVWNIAPQSTQVLENTVPRGAVQGKNSDGTNNWVAPCPPTGIHHYQFSLYALDTVLNLPASTDKAGLEKAMDTHIIELAILVGQYQKKVTAV